VHKLKDVLRVREESEVFVFDGKGKQFSYAVASIDKKKISLNKKKLNRSAPLAKRRIVLGFPLTQEAKVDFILQKATELGVFKFIPFRCERSLRRSPSAERLGRWQKIVIEATRQSERLWVPEIEGVVEFSSLTRRTFACKCAASYRGRKIKSLPAGEGECLIVVGPEGDFSEQEYGALERCEFKFIKLSHNTLRLETAAIFSVGLLSYFHES